MTDNAGRVMERTQSNSTARSTYLYFDDVKIADLSWSGTTLSMADFDQAYDAVAGGSGTALRRSQGKAPFRGRLPTDG